VIIKTFGRHFVLRILIILTIQLTFVVAKFIGLLTWPWVWVMVPFLITGTVLGIVLCIAAVLILISGD
jgi:hypothetical protein